MSQRPRSPGTPQERILAAGLDRRPFGISLHVSTAPSGADHFEEVSPQPYNSRCSGALSTPTATSPHGHMDSTRASVLVNEDHNASAWGTSRHSSKAKSKKFASNIFAFLLSTDSEQEEEKSGTASATAGSYSLRANPYTRHNLAAFATPDIRISSPGQGFVAPPENIRRSFAAYEGINDVVHTDRHPPAASQQSYMITTRRMLITSSMMQLALFGWFFIPSAATFAGGFVGLGVLVIGFFLAFVVGITLERRCYNSRGSVVTTSYLDLAEAAGGESLRLLSAFLTGAVWLSSACILFALASLMLYTASMEFSSQNEQGKFFATPGSSIYYYYTAVCAFVFVVCVPLKTVVGPSAIHIWKTYMFTIVALVLAFIVFVVNVTLVVVHTKAHAIYSVTDRTSTEFFTSTLPQGMALMLWAWAPVLIVPRMGTANPFFHRSSDRAGLHSGSSPARWGKSFYKAWLVITLFVITILLIFSVILMTALGTQEAKYPIVLLLFSTECSPTKRGEQLLHAIASICLVIIFAILIVRHLTTLAQMIPSGSKSVSLPQCKLRDDEEAEQSFNLLLPGVSQRRSPARRKHKSTSDNGKKPSGLATFVRDAVLFGAVLFLVALCSHTIVCGGDQHCRADTTATATRRLATPSQALALFATVTAGLFLSPLVFFLPLIFDNALSAPDENVPSRMGSMADYSTMEFENRPGNSPSSSHKFVESLRYHGAPEEEWPLAVPRDTPWRDRTASQASFLPEQPSKCATLCTRVTKLATFLWAVVPMVGAIQAIIDLYRLH